jgi:tetratricopeptide (TPR) repeat protein
MAPTNNPSPQEQLALEVALLDDGRLALARGEFARTANLAERYLATYPSGRLEQEARYLRMQAERALGNQRDAERDARRLLELNPNGPHARAARKVLE